MRKRTVNHVADTVFWYLLYFLPILCYLFYMIAQPSTGTNVIAFNSFMASLNLGMLTNNVIYDVLNQIFGVDGVFAMLAPSGIILFFTYFVNVYIAHLLIDFILFIPRLAHKWLKECTQGD